MSTHHGCSEVKLIHGRDDLGANLWMFAHDYPFFFCQRPGFIKNIIRNADLANIVKFCSPMNVDSALLLRSQARSPFVQPSSGYPLAVAIGIFITGIDRICQGGNRLQVRTFKLRE